MEVATSANGASSADASRRKSGRVTKKPDMLDPSFGGRTLGQDDSDDVDMDDDDEDEDEDDAPDEEEARDKKRKARSATASKAKRPKLNGGTSTLAFRTSAPKSRKRAPARRSDAVGAGGLYADVFAGDNTTDKVALDWLARYREDDAAGIAELVNFALRCAGCQSQIDSSDVEDPDHASSKLQDLQDEYQAAKIITYPLIDKNKASSNVRQGLFGLYTSVIKTVAFAQESILFNQAEFIENVEVWIAALSSATNRPFRHTATVVSLAIIHALCEVARSLSESHAKTLRQRDGEQKSKKKSNKGRLSEIQELADEQSTRIQVVNNMIKDWFDTVVVHRYRDIDPRIRGECLTAIAEWMTIYPDHFLNGEHLRYLGWMLVDTTAQTRLEIIKGLKKMYKDDNRLGGLRQFTDRFRERFVEMATRDAEVNVRAATVELLEILRDKGLLEPDDIDTIGNLLFDFEPRVRSAVVPFFVASVQESYDAKVEELGGAEEVEEALPTPDDDDFESLRLDWLQFKSLAELMQLYDTQESSIKSAPDTSFEEAVLSSRSESRFSMAASALLEDLEIVREWETLAGYLLFDTSAVRGNEADIEGRVTVQCKLEDSEIIILLDVLNASVSHALSDLTTDGAQKKAKKTKAELRELEELQETAAQRLAEFIPRLLNKFNDRAETVASVLRLARLLNLDVFQELRQDTTVFSSLLDDINKQFLTHEDEHVQSEARAALLHAKSFKDLDDVTEVKLQTLWDDTTYGITALCVQENLRQRGGLDVTVVNALSSQANRLASLASISDCTEPFEKTQTLKVKNKSRRRQTEQGSPTAPITNLIEMLGRGAPLQRQLAPKLETAENQLVAHTIKAVLFYFMWQVQALSTNLSRFPTSRLHEVVDRVNLTANLLLKTLGTRRGADELRLSAAGAYLDLHILFAKFLRPDAISKASQEAQDTFALLQPVGPDGTKILNDVFAAAERDYARKVNKKLEEPDDDDEPEDLSDSEDEDDQSNTREDKQRASLIAEERLCTLGGKIVLAILAGAVDAGSPQGPVRRRLFRNRARLGTNFKAVCATLEAQEEADKPKARADGSSRNQTTTGKKSTKSAAVVVEEDSDEEEEEMPDEHDEEELRRRGLLGDDIEDDEDDDRRAREATGEVESMLGD